MTGLAGGTELTVVGVIRLVAGIAVLRRAFVLAVLMTVLTGYRSVFAFQFECGQVVVELGGFPSFGRVTNAAVGSKAPLMSVILEMTRFAGGGESRQVVQGMGVLVTGRTGGVLVLAGQDEAGLGVVELTETVMPIVAGQTVCAEIGQVGGHPGRIQFLVTFQAGLLVEACQGLGVAIVTGEGNAGRTVAVGGQSEARDFMGKGGGIHNGQRG